MASSSRGPVLSTVESPRGSDLLVELAAAVGVGDLEAAVEAAASIAGSPAALLRPDRTLLAASDPERWGLAADRARTLRWVSGNRHPGRELTITAGTHRLGVLVFRRELGTGLDTDVWSAVHDVLSLALLARDATERAERAEQQAALLACLCEGSVLRGTERCEEIGAVRTPSRAPAVRQRPAVLTPVGPADTDSTGPMERARRDLAGDSLLAGGQLAVLRDRAVYVYTEPADATPPAQAEAWRRFVAAAAPRGWRVAVGLPEVSGRALQESYRTARWLADLQSAPLPGLRLDDVVLVDELGVVAATLGPRWGSRLGHFIGRVLGDVVHNPRFGGEILDTLHAYLVSGSSPTEAARMLHLSPSSMKYRMRIIREELGDRLDDHDSAFEIELALRLLKSFEASRGQAPAGEHGSAPAAGRESILVPGSR